MRSPSWCHKHAHSHFLQFLQNKTADFFISFHSPGGHVRIQLGRSYGRETQTQCNSPSLAHANTLCIIMYSVLISILRHVNFSQYVLAPQVTSEWKEMNRCPNLLYSESGQSLITLCTVAQVNLPDWSKQCVIVSTFLLHRPLPLLEVTLCLIKDWLTCVGKMCFTWDSITVCRNTTTDTLQTEKSVSFKIVLSGWPL